MNRNGFIVHPAMRWITLAIGILTSGIAAQEVKPFECPERGCKLVDTKENGSATFVSCGSGVGFTVGPVTYKPSEDMCPLWVETVPSHTETDNATVAPNKYTDNGETFDITRQNYKCSGMGCGLLWLSGCCRPDGQPTVVNTLYNCKELNCKEPRPEITESISAGRQ